MNISSSKKIVIGIPTFRRPDGLSRLLASIAKQQSSFTPHILVADNEGHNGAGLAVVEKLRNEGFPFPITGIPVPERGISQVRNALMCFAFEDLSADALAMVDDDERVEPEWIASLVDMQERTEADVVEGLAFPEFEEMPPKWAVGLDVYCPKKTCSPGIIPMAGATRSILLSSTLRTKFDNPEFNKDFSLTGNGDFEFFYRLKTKGARFAYAPEAVSYEFFSSSRLTKRWVFERSFRIGSGRVRVLKMHSLSVFGWMREITKLIIATGLSLIMALVFLGSESLRMRACLMLIRQAGKVNGILGTPPQVYKKIHGN